MLAITVVGNGILVNNPDDPGKATLLSGNETP